MRSLSVSPSTYSKTMCGAPSSSPASITVTTWGWLSCATARASRRKRSSWSGSVEMSRCMSLIATWRSSVGSKARYTLDIPPEPILSSSRKRWPMRVPITVIYFLVVSVPVRYYTDPASSASWAAEPHLRCLLMEFGAEVEITYVMGGLARELTGDVSALVTEWLEVADRAPPGGAAPDGTGGARAVRQDGHAGGRGGVRSTRSAGIGGAVAPRDGVEGEAHAGPDGHAVGARLVV